MKLDVYHVNPSSKSIWKKQLFLSQHNGLKEIIPNECINNSILGCFIEAVGVGSGDFSSSKEYKMESKIILTELNSAITWVTSNIRDYDQKDAIEFVKRTWSNNLMTFIIVE